MADGEVIAGSVFAAGDALTDYRRSVAEKADALRRAAQFAVDQHVAEVPDLLDYLTLIYRHAAAEDVLAMDALDLLGLSLSLRTTGLIRQPGEVNLRIYNPSLDEDGWSCGHTVVEVVCDDMSFLVDSLTGELTREGRAIHFVLHPQLLVRRSETGALQSLTELVNHEGRSEEVPEAWIHFGIDRDTDPDSLAYLATRLRAVLSDVACTVGDWGAMRLAVADAAVEVSQETITGLPDDARAEAVAFLNWLVDGHFTMLGYREYRLTGEPGREALELVPNSGLGILRADESSRPQGSVLPAPAARRARDPQPLIITKANSRSTVHRNSYLDYIGIKVFDQRGEVIGERRLLGLFTAAAYAQSVRQIPLLRLKAEQVLASSGYPADSHGGKDLMQFLETYPRDELFQVDAPELLDVAMAVLYIQERRQTRLFLRRDPYDRFVSALVYLPRDRFNTTVRERMVAILTEAFGAETVDFATRISESVLARLHFIVRVARSDTLPEVDVAVLEAELAAAARSWDDDFADALVDQMGEESASHLRNTYLPVITGAFKEAYPARTAVADICRLSKLGPDALDLNFYRPMAGSGSHRRLKVYRSGDPITLSAMLPLLQNFGLAVTDERPFTFAPPTPGGDPLHIYDFGLELASTPVGSEPKSRFEDTFEAIWQGRAESDGFNALVLGAGLTWQQALILRVISRYLRQIGLPFSQEYVESCAATHPQVAALLVTLFAARFDPALGDAADAPDAESAVANIVTKISAELDAIPSADHDRILRSMLSVILATVRTNFYAPTSDGQPRSTVSLKLRPAQVLGIPKPTPAFEIWVYSPRVEGVHLRFGQVARGGLRWSGRPEDFRTEVLGLVKAQAVKNAVIVPVGAKGGFFPKQLPATGDRSQWLAEGQAAYRCFISALLDITDNLVAGAVVGPPGVVRHDGDDPYLVVAADKGTATFSDLANEISLEYGFWLGDAFASGGSDGYDHKEMGITARGAWESVKQHFRELGVNTQAQDFTAVGIGDMSGDVFGNAMLLSSHLRLVAAFDHRHIFLDPNPDGTTSLAERRRLFTLPRSSWADYSPDLISSGGGVYSRQSKSIPISPQVGQMLGLGVEVTTLAPPELIRAILTAPVDLLFNGGIGTYVKAVTESNPEVGDKANDAVRVNGAQLRCRVVGEGGNLGLTQRGRIEAALHGAKLNTDAIDNSAGVDTSDHEVNIKILVDAVQQAGDITAKQRRELLATMTDEVADLVLQNNYDQNMSLATTRGLTGRSVGVQARLIRDLELNAGLDRALEFLPSEEEIQERQNDGLGLTSPELSVLLAYSKMSLKSELTATILPDDPYFAGVLRDYFPLALQLRYAAEMEQHPLRRDIVITSLVNDLIDHGGSTFAFRVREDLGASSLEVVRGYAFTRDVFQLPGIWRRIQELCNQVPAGTQVDLLLEVRRLLDRGTRWLVQNKGIDLDLQREVDRYAEPVQRIGVRIPDLLLGKERAEYDEFVARYLRGGTPADLASDVASLLYRFQLLDVVTIAQRAGESVDSVAPLYFVVTERFGVDQLLTRISALPRTGRWQSLARQALRTDLYAATAALTLEVATQTPDHLDATERLARWESMRDTEVGRVHQVLREIDALDAHDLATLSVAMRSIRTLLSQSRAARMGSDAR